MEDLLSAALSLLRNIQRSRKGSIGSPDNAYLPQLRVDRIDELAVRISTMLADLDSAESAREVVIEESILLGPGTYTIVLGELFRIVDETPPELDPLPEDAGILKAGDGIPG